MHNGVIGFFDILGYQSLLENNHGNSGHEIVERLSNWENELPQIMRDFTHPDDLDKLEHLVSQFRILVFSDSILQYFTFTTEDPARDKCNKLQFQILATMLLWREMFYYGLPIRGAIHFGEFEVVKSCFMGRAILEAYRTCQNLNFAGCVYTQSALREMMMHINNQTGNLLHANIRGQMFNYLAPTHSKNTSQCAVINPLGCRSDRWTDLTQGDLRQLIYESFAKHKKDVSEAVRSKLDNTEQYLRACKHRINSNADTPALMRIAGLET